MSEERTLLIGIDLDDEYAQISNFQKKRMEPEPVSFAKDEEDYLIPTCLCVTEQTKEWLFGQEAMECSERSEGQLVSGLLAKLENEETTIIYGQEFRAEALLLKYFRKIFRTIQQIYGNTGIQKLVVTTKQWSIKIQKQLLEILSQLGIEEDRAVILSHVQCFMYYTICQKQELWQHEVALFEYGREGLRFYLLTFNKNTTPVVVALSYQELKETMPFRLLKEVEHERLSNQFEELANQTLHKRMVTTLYATGIGFASNFADSALRNLCNGRRVFKGQNLYVYGACYAAYAISSGLSEQFVLLEEDRITAEVGIRVYQDAIEQELVLAKPGTLWREVNREIFVILDNTDEIFITITNILKIIPIIEMMKLEGLGIRENKTIRVSVKLHFIEQNVAVLTVRDTGFGDFYEKSYRIWEQIIRIE